MARDVEVAVRAEAEARRLRKAGPAARHEYDEAIERRVEPAHVIEATIGDEHDAVVAEGDALGIAQAAEGTHGHARGAVVLLDAVVAAVGDIEVALGADGKTRRIRQAAA